MRRSDLVHWNSPQGWERVVTDKRAFVMRFPDTYSCKCAACREKEGASRNGKRAQPWDVGNR